MKRTAGKGGGEPVQVGDASVARILARALMERAEVDRWTHGFHAWPAGLHPDAAAGLVAAFPGDVLDPFCGGGTVLVEALAAGRRSVGRDLSPIAVRVARGRGCTADEALLTRVRSRARKLTEAARQASALPPGPILGAMEQWYAPHALWELESLRQGIAASDPDVRPLLELLFSSILVKVSWRRSDTSVRRVKHKRPPGTTAILFHKKARELGRRIAALRADVPQGTPEVDVALGDARAIEVSQPVGLVLTSPPYPSTYDYLRLQHLRNVWLDERPRVDQEIGSRQAWRQGDAQARRTWREDTIRWTASAASVLRPGGHLVVVIGDGLTPSGVVDTSQPTEEAAHAAGLVSVARASVERADHARETTRWEHILAFRKPD